MATVDCMNCDVARANTVCDDCEAIFCKSCYKDLHSRRCFAWHRPLRVLTALQISQYGFPALADADPATDAADPVHAAPVLPDDPAAMAMCDTHEDCTLILGCITCNKPLCRMCESSGTHSGHDVKSVSQYTTHVRRELRRVASRLCFIPRFLGLREEAAELFRASAAAALADIDFTSSLEQIDAEIRSLEEAVLGVDEGKEDEAGLADIDTALTHLLKQQHLISSFPGALLRLEEMLEAVQAAVGTAPHLTALSQHIAAILSCARAPLALRLQPLCYNVGAELEQDGMMHVMRLKSERTIVSTSAVRAGCSLQITIDVKARRPPVRIFLVAATRVGRLRAGLDGVDDSDGSVDVSLGGSSSATLNLAARPARSELLMSGGGSKIFLAPAEVCVLVFQLDRAPPAYSFVEITVGPELCPVHDPDEDDDVIARSVRPAVEPVVLHAKHTHVIEAEEKVADDGWESDDAGFLGGFFFDGEDDEDSPAEYAGDCPADYAEDDENNGDSDDSDGDFALPGLFD